MVVATLRKFSSGETDVSSVRETCSPHGAAARFWNQIGDSRIHSAEEQGQRPMISCAGMILDKAPLAGPNSAGSTLFNPPLPWAR
jgi:hypothetical protein